MSNLGSEILLTEVTAEIQDASLRPISQRRRGRVDTRLGAWFTSSGSARSWIHPPAIPLWVCDNSRVPFLKRSPMSLHINFVITHFPDMGLALPGDPGAFHTPFGYVR